jgi:hypothetical protein
VEALPRRGQTCDDEFLSSGAASLPLRAFKPVLLPRAPRSRSPARSTAQYPLGAALAAQSVRFGVHSLLIAVGFCTLGSAGCLRFGYGAHVDAGDAKRDAGTDDAGPVAAGGRAGATGNACTSADSGSHDAASQSSGGAGSDDSDAGASGAGAADGGELAVSSLCPERPSALFCDGFEDPSFSRWTYTVSNNGSLTRSTAHAHSGMTSLLATTGPAARGTEARWQTAVLANQKSADAWMRFYDWVPASVIVTQYFSVRIMSETAMPYDGFELRLLPLFVDINSSSGVFQGLVSFPRDRWVCVEMHVLIDPIAGVYEAYLDGTLAVRSPPSNTLPADGFSAAEVGVHFAGPSQGPVKVYIDDVVVGRSRIPCD